MDFSAIDQQLDDAAARGVVPGAAVVVATPEGVVHQATAGPLRAGGEGGAVGEDTMFRYASMTKALASVGALQLVEQGRLDLDAEVRSILPAFGDLQVLDGFDGDTPRLRAPASQATVRQLLTHTAGCGYWFANADLLRHLGATGIPDPIQGLRAALDAPLVNDPGTRWEYGTNTDWLGLVVEAVSGQTLDAYLAEHLFGPLGMTEATFTPSDDQRARMMPIHHRLPDGGLAPGELELPPDPEFQPAGHGAAGTAGDYGRFIAALLGGGTLDGAQVLEPGTVDLMLSDHLRGAPLPEVIHSAIPELCNDIPSLPVPQGWGLGLHLTLADLPGMRRAGTGDWAGLFNCYYWIDRASGIGAAFLTQVLPFFDQAIVETTLGIEQGVYAAAGLGAGEPALS
jgi:CubicO group peptidase (beta-lactamase class C family)